MKFRKLFRRKKETNSARKTGTEDGGHKGGAPNGRMREWEHNIMELLTTPSNSLQRMRDLNGIMKALRDPNIYMIGVCGMDDHDHLTNLLDSVIRRVTRDHLFGVTVMVSISDDKPNLTTIQQDIAHQLGFSYQQRGKKTPSCCVFPSRTKKVVSENAKQLSDRIRTQPNILFILRDLHTTLDLAKLGILFGKDHNGCKLILTSRSNEILSNQMNVVQRTFMV